MSELTATQQECLRLIEEILQACRQGGDLAMIRARLRTLRGVGHSDKPPLWLSIDRRKVLVAEWNERVPELGPAIVDVLAPFATRKFFLQLMPPSKDGLGLLVDHLGWPEISTVRIVTPEDLQMFIEEGDLDLDQHLAATLWEQLEAIHRSTAYPPPPTSQAIARYMRESWRSEMHINFAVDQALQGYDWPGDEEAEEEGFEERLLQAIFSNGETEQLPTRRDIRSLVKRNLIACLWMAMSQAAGVDFKRNMRWLTELWIHGMFPLGFDHNSNLVILCGETD